MQSSLSCSLMRQLHFMSLEFSRKGELMQFQNNASFWGSENFCDLLRILDFRSRFPPKNGKFFLLARLIFEIRHAATISGRKNESTEKQLKKKKKIKKKKKTRALRAQQGLHITWMRSFWHITSLLVLVSCEENISDGLHTLCTAESRVYCR